MLIGRSSDAELPKLADTLVMQLRELLPVALRLSGNDQHANAVAESKTPREVMRECGWALLDLVPFGAPPLGWTPLELALMKIGAADCDDEGPRSRAGLLAAGLVETICAIEEA